MLLIATLMLKVNSQAVLVPVVVELAVEKDIPLKTYAGVLIIIVKLPGIIAKKVLQQMQLTNVMKISTTLAILDMEMILILTIH